MRTLSLSLPQSTARQVENRIRRQDFSPQHSPVHHPSLKQNPSSPHPTPGHRALELFLETRCSNMMPFVDSNKEQGCQNTGVETLNGSLDITK